MNDATRHARFDALFAAHRGPVFAYLLGRAGDRDRAADLLQETFVRAWRHLDDAYAVPEDRRRFYLLRLAASAATDALRRDRTRAHLEAPFPEASAHVAPPPTLLATAVEEAIRALPEDLRTVLTMQLVGGLTSQEIGEALGKPAGTVRSQLHDARRILERNLAPWVSGVPQ